MTPGALVALHSAGLILAFSATNVPGTVWTSFKVRLDETTWGASSASQMVSVLNNLTEVRIRGMFSANATGSTVSLDNVAFVAVCTNEVPRLSLERLGGSQLLLQWPGPPGCFQLESAADVVALPALYEPFGNVHLEAMASGVPVLSSAGAGGSEIIQQGENGWVVGKPVAPPTIAEGLAALKEVPAEGWAERVRPTVESFTYATQAEGFSEIYQKLRG